MIISHRLKVIYIKLEKVAGTSFEIALSKYCDHNYIITPIRKRDEAIRQSLGFNGPHNYTKLNNVSLEFYNHISAQKIKRLIPSDIWNNYLKIATIRCPYDMFISSYYASVPKWRRGNFYRKTLDEFVTNNNVVLMRVCDLHIEGKIPVDFLIRYENLNEDIKNLEGKINCPGLLRTFQDITAKGNRRPQTGTSCSEIYSKYPKAKIIIDKRCYENADKYEFFQKYWFTYKFQLEKTMRIYCLNFKD